MATIWSKSKNAFRAGYKDMRVNEFGQPIGEDVVDFDGATPPNTETMRGRFVTLEKVDPSAHAASLFEAYALDSEGRNWTYLPAYRPQSVAATKAWLEQIAASKDPLFVSVIDNETGRAIGVASFLRMQPDVGGIEVGYITFSPLLQRSPKSTETMYLMMARVFDDWGYRRYEWKCDALNAPSRAAAARLGFSFEGVFRQATIYKGRNRDTAWFAITDSEWPTRRAIFQDWLSEANFDADGQQKVSLGQIAERHLST